MHTSSSLVRMVFAQQMGVLAFFKRRSGAIQLAMMIVVLAVSVILGALLRNRRPPFTSRQVQLCVRQAKL